MGDEHGQDLDVLDQLDQLETDWVETEAIAGFEDLPSDTYQCRIDDAVINNAKSTGRLQVTWTFTVANGTYVGRQMWKHDGLDDKEQRGRFRDGLERLGVAWPEPPLRDTLPPLLEDLKNSYCEVKLNVKPKRGGAPGEMSDFKNILRALNNDEVQDDTGEAVAEEAPPARPPARGRPAAPSAAPARATTAGRAASSSQPTRQAAQPTQAEASSADEYVVETTFKVQSINRALKKRLDEVALEQQMVLEDYGDNKVDMMADLAEYLGISGTFNDPESLMAEIEVKVAQ